LKEWSTNHKGNGASGGSNVTRGKGRKRMQLKLLMQVASFPKDRRSLSRWLIYDSKDLAKPIKRADIE